VIIGAKSMDQLRDNIDSTRVHLMSPTADNLPASMNQMPLRRSNECKG
jgi:aryl-alcohol dehydrogenase-like predicted oxidoreductase